ncbi:multidrug transporter MATE [Lachnospiraceae bacterium oral taxon 500]|nr:multidrug transporter MATE [Lachnospiraceae bacterium oral taxon 500]
MQNILTKNFLKNVIPSMLAFAFSGVYIIIDGIFVGRNTGDIGLSAININYPAAALMQAAGTGIGMAGGIWISMKRGSRDNRDEALFLGNSLCLLLLASLLLGGLLLATYPLLLPLLGARDELLKPSTDYLRIIIYGTAFQVLGTGLVPLVRNYNGALRAMRAMILGLAANTVLDYLFIERFGWGTAGAAAATVLGQAMTLFCLLPFFFYPRRLFALSDLKPHPAVLKKILPLARSPFGVTLIPNVVIIFLNRGTLTYGGVLAVSAYAVISYVIYIVQLLVQGIGDGSQPMISRYYGAKDNGALLRLRRLSYAAAGLIGTGSALALYLTRYRVPVWFGSSPAAAAMYADVLSFFLLGAMLASLLRPGISYLYAINHNRAASTLIYGEPAVLVLLLFALPPFLGLTGVWLAVPLSQVLMLLLSVYYVRQSDGENQRKFLLK